MALLVPIFSLLFLSLASGAVGLHNLRSARTLEPSVPGIVSRELVANAPRAIELDLQVHSEGARKARCSLPGEKEFPPESLNQSEDLRFCAERGLKNFMKFAEPFPLEDKSTFMPTFSSHSLTRPKRGITHAVIWMHGGRMNANKYACDALNLTAAAGAANQTLTIVPFFSVEQMTKKQWSGDPHAEDHVSVCWNNSKAWMSGAESADATTTAFGAVDRIVLALQTEFAEVFPDLKRIVVTGFSGGCQLLQRWSFFSRVLLPDFSKLPVTIILGSCGSYMYLDKTRPAESCSPLMHSGTDHTCDKFHVPEHDICPQYDTFKYGLSLHQSKHTGYLRSFAEYNTLIKSGQDDYFHKDIRFLLGDVDACSCNIDGYYNPPDMCFPAIGEQCTPNSHGGFNGYEKYSCCDTYPGGTSNNVAHTCEALVQGSNRLQRGLNFLGHLRDFYERHDNSSYHPVFGIFAGSHNSTAAYTSETFRRWVFGDMKGVNRTRGAEAGFSKAREPGDDPYASAYDWGGDAYDWSDDDESPPEVGATPAPFVATTTAQAAEVPPMTTGPPPATPTPSPAGSPWVTLRQNWNCNGANGPESGAETISNDNAECLTFCVNYAFAGFWPNEHLCRCYSTCAAVGGETSPDFPNTVYQKRDWE